VNVIDEARGAYARGRLVPFLGSGVSREVCRTWTGMIEALERLPGAADRSTLRRRGTDDLSLADRAARALERRRLGMGILYAESVRAALLENGAGAPPLTTVALAALHWPLVLTTNYDDLYVAAVHQLMLGTRRGGRPRTSEIERRTAPVQVVGRSSVDCHRVLCGLSTPAAPMLWALQGYLGGQATVTDPRWETLELYADWAVPYGAVDLSRRGTGPGLDEQIVVGHAEYRRVALRSTGFRRTFAEVVRQRSLLFVGSGLADRYLLDLFGEIIELYGPSAQPHYAIVTRDTLDGALLQRNYGIWVHEIDSHDDLPELVTRLRGSPPVRRYAYGSSAALVLNTAPMPVVRDPAACVVLSGGGSDDREQPRLAGWASRYVAQYADHGRGSGVELFEKDSARRFVWRLRNPVENGPLILVGRARLDPRSEVGKAVNPISAATIAVQEQAGREARGRLWRDLRVTAAVLHEVLAVARAEGKSRVVAPVLASGGLRTVPRPIMLHAMLHAWSDAEPANRPALTIHVVDEDVRIDLESGRIDPARLLPPPGDAGMTRPLPFWLELAPAGAEPERILVVSVRDRPVAKLLADYGVAGERWLCTVEPAACLGGAGWTIAEIDAWTGPSGEPLSLERIGVLYGSTVRVQEEARR
jgi:hypothetical protein